MRKITKIILHCAATKEGQDFHASDIDRWHKDRGWNGIGYHYVIDLDGKIENGRPIELAGAHCSGHNANSIGICYIGGCDKNGKAKDTRTPEQRFSLFKLVMELMEKYKLNFDQIFGHYELTVPKGAKACPSFKIETFVKELKMFIEKRGK